jgi:orotate phosphoribosyltransferase
MADPETARSRLIEIVKARSLRTGAAIKLASGKTSTFYVNLKPTMLDPEGAHLIADLILDELSDAGIDLVGGMEMGAVPSCASRPRTTARAAWWRGWRRGKLWRASVSSCWRM